MKPGPDVAVIDASGDADIGQTTTSMGIGESESNEIRRFELLRNELMELEKRVQKSTDQYENEEDIKVTDDDANYHDEAASSQLIHVPRNENIIRKSIAKLKKKSKDVLQGTQLLAIDVAASMGLLKRLFIGDELTEKERKTLRRTMMDLASVVPIGVLMLLPLKVALGQSIHLEILTLLPPSNSALTQRMPKSVFSFSLFLAISDFDFSAELIALVFCLEMASKPKPKSLLTHSKYWSLMGGLSSQIISDWARHGTVSFLAFGGVDDDGFLAHMEQVLMH
ncbi:hypothetical protein DKX38_024007 [Salix brachista]|uniref:Uncharacterized protein n=1 Tax=Salix brachista TaxID=2182728 RepID=A0A5N5JKA8_9ROSI|nr:hypothetical protein DKX38_024007 [Salix brachista]